jgi:hypothetical protein
MNIYKISQTKHKGWDTFRRAVVVAESAEVASRIHPDFRIKRFEDWPRDDEDFYGDRAWVSDPSDVVVELLGVAESKLPAGVVMADFNAG